MYLKSHSQFEKVHERCLDARKGGECHIRVEQAVVVRFGARRFVHEHTNAMASLDNTVGTQCRYGLANDSPADAKLLGQFVERSEFHALFELAFGDMRLQRLYGAARQCIQKNTRITTRKLREPIVKSRQGSTTLAGDATSLRDLSRERVCTLHSESAFSLFASHLRATYTKIIFNHFAKIRFLLSDDTIKKLINTIV